MKNVRIDYTVYSPGYKSSRNSKGEPQEGSGECWDAISMRNAKRLAKRFGTGSIIVRNFNQNDVPRGRGEWTQADKCWVWNGGNLSKLSSLEEKKWVVPNIHQAINALRRKISRKR